MAIVIDHIVPIYVVLDSRLFSAHGILITSLEYNFKRIFSVFISHFNAHVLGTITLYIYMHFTELVGGALVVVVDKDVILLVILKIRLKFCLFALHIILL